MSTVFRWCLGYLVIGLWHSTTVYSQTVRVAPHDATEEVKSGADFVCKGTQDEATINQAISKLSAVHQELVAGPKFLGLSIIEVESTGIWKPTDSQTTIRPFADDDTARGLRIFGSGKNYPGLAIEGSTLDLTAFDSFELMVHSNSAIKIRVILQDREQQEMRFHEKVPSPGSWHRLRFYLSQPYRGAADLSAITAIRIQATTELEGCEFSVAQACFTRDVKLAHDRIHPGTLQVKCADHLLKPEVDFVADLEQGVIRLFNDQSATITYRHGGGMVHLAPGNYRIAGPTGVELRSYCELDCHGAILTAADAFAAPGQLLQTAANFSHTTISIRGGQFRGQRTKWPTQQNVGGIILRDTDNIVVEGCEITDFNSAGLAIVNTHFKDKSHPRPRRVTIANSRIARCATEYVDIRDDLYGEVGKGSDHKAMLRLAGVRDFELRHNRLEDSFGDAKWVVGCEDGVIIGNTIENSRMGSYFIEGSIRIIGTANMIRNAGSRAVTIERGSHENTFCNNVIVNSYREGLWLMGCSECLIQGNRFENNGWRNSAGLDSAIKIEWQEKFAKEQASYNLISHNVIKTRPHQDQAIWVASGEHSKGNTITDNLIMGAKVAVRDDGVETIEARNQLQR